MDLVWNEFKKLYSTMEWNEGRGIWMRDDPKLCKQKYGFSCVISMLPSMQLFGGNMSSLPASTHERYDNKALEGIRDE